MRVFLSRYRGYLTCPDCGGARLRREARDVRVSGRTIDRVAALTVREARRLALVRAGLLAEPEARALPRGARARAMAVVRRFGYLQLDTVSIAGARSRKSWNGLASTSSGRRGVPPSEPAGTRSSFGEIGS